MPMQQPMPGYVQPGFVQPVVAQPPSAGSENVKFEICSVYINTC